MKKSKVFISVMIFTFLLQGCFASSNMSKMANEHSNEEFAETQRGELVKITDAEFVEEMDEITLYPGDIQESNNLNVEEYAVHINSIFTSFAKGEIDIDEFELFLRKHSSSDSPYIRNENLRETLIMVADIYNELDKNIYSFRTSDINFNEEEYAYFYREVISERYGSEFFETTLVKEEGNWKLYNDEPTKPVQIGGE